LGDAGSLKDVMSAKHFTGVNPSRVVLLVDDDQNDVDLMRMAFSRAKASCQLISVSDGDEAIRYLAGDGKYEDRDLFPFPMLVLLDLRMPRVSGFEVLEWVRDQGEGMPLVVTLSYSQLEDEIRRAYDLGTNAFVAKPLDLESSVSLVKLLINLEWMVSLRSRKNRQRQESEGGESSIEASP
jgi:CheY-like chemotaxis protein